MKRSSSLIVGVFFLFFSTTSCFRSLFIIATLHSVYVSGAATRGEQQKDNGDKEEACLATSDGNDSPNCRPSTTIEQEKEEKKEQDRNNNLQQQMKKEEKSIKCEDKNKKCSEWADIGECTKNPRYMNVHCRRSCELCKDQIRSNPKLKLLELIQGADMGVPQTFPTNEDEEKKVRKVLEDARKYLEEDEVKKLGKFVIDKCRNQNEKCAEWAEMGECEKNPKYMKETCAPVCKSCDYLTVEGRCPIDPDAPNAWEPGDLDKMFQRLSSEPYLSQYSVEILSSPDTGGPWVITMENVITEEEAEHLIELGSIEGYKRSADVGPLKPDGTYKPKIGSGRTSTNAWCQNECYKNATALTVVERLSNLTEIEETNSEYLQLLRYEVTQHYGVHHDYTDHHLRRQPGVRILTVFLYLNDVPAGGGTNFPRLDLTVTPKRGRVLLWPSVFDDKPNEIDERTTHQALPVEEGVKYGANAWFHMRDFKNPVNEGCS